MDDENQTEGVCNLSITSNGVTTVFACVKGIEINGIDFCKLKSSHDSCECFYYFIHPTGKCVPNCIFFRPPQKKELKTQKQSCPYPAKRCKFKSFVERNSKFFVTTGVKHG